MTEKVDILVVGSGPAGSVTARYAAMTGASVMMIERRPQVGVPVRCGEFMVSDEEIMSMFPRLKDEKSLFDIPEELHCRETVGIRLINPDDKVTTLDFNGYTIDRDKFDQYLASLATEAGAQLSMNHMFLDIEDGVAKTNKGDIEYKVIVGADGPGSRVARSLGLQKNRNPYPAMTAQVKGDFEPYVQMFFGGIAPGAYGWIIPKDGRANIGVGFSPKFAKDALNVYFDKFVERHDFKIEGKAYGKFVPSEGPIPQTVRGNGMVVGDAAGQVISVNGGGIPLAMIAGRICGNVAGDHIKNGTSLDNYDAQWRDIMGQPLKTAAFNKKLADTFAFRTDATTKMCMAMLGKRRLGNLIRCKSLFP